MNKYLERFYKVNVSEVWGGVEMQTALGFYAQLTKLYHIYHSFLKCC